MQKRKTPEAAFQVFSLFKQAFKVHLWLLKAAMKPIAKAYFRYARPFQLILMGRK